MVAVILVGVVVTVVADSVRLVSTVEEGEPPVPKYWDKLPDIVQVPELTKAQKLTVTCCPAKFLTSSMDC